MDWLADSVFLSRLLFALTTGFHILWPPLTIGLALFLVLLEGLWLKTGDPDWYRHCRFFGKLLALNFAVGVVSGIPLEFEFGTNWAPFSRAVGHFFGQVLGFEATMAFMLESAFLYLMLKGWKRLSPAMHYFSTIMVAAGASLSAFLIMVANAWMHTPTGGHLEGGVFVIDDYFAALFSPDLFFAFTHLFAACLEVGLFVAGAVSAASILKGLDVAFHLKAFRMAVIAAVIVAPLQAVLGDGLGREVWKTQPAKLAAIESHWVTNAPGTGADWSLIAWPDAEAAQNRFELSIPSGLSLLLTDSLTGRIVGLRDFPKEDRPPVVLPYYAFRIMMAVGFAMVGLMAWTVYAWRRGGLSPEAAPGKRLLLWSWIAMAAGSYVAVETGFITREVGRQPWIVYNLVRTADAASPLPAGAVLASLLAYLAAYGVLSAVFGYFAWRLLGKGPDLAEAPPALAGRPAPGRA